jgi:hypothetical protein
MPTSSTALDRPRPAELWRAYPLGPNAVDAETAPDQPSERAAKTPLGDVDSRGQSSLPLQLGVMFASLLAAFAAGWYLPDPRVSARLGRARRGAHRSGRANGASTPPAALTCEIAWQGGDPRGRFQAVVASADGRSRRAVAESADVPWPPVDGRTPPTNELEAALGSLVASLEAAGWEPIASGDSWSQRRFVWRHAGEPPPTIEVRERTEAGSPASDRYAGAARPRGARRRRSEGRAARRR